MLEGLSKFSGQIWILPFSKAFLLLVELVSEHESVLFRALSTQNASTNEGLLSIYLMKLDLLIFGFY